MIMSESQRRKVRVKILWFDYTDKKGKEQHARRNDVIEVDDDDYARGVLISAFAAELEDPNEVEESGDGVSDSGSEVEVHAMSVDELSEWIQEERPSIKTIVSLANGDTALAKKLLRAENAATGNDPRVGLVKGLEEVIGRGAQ